MLLAKWNEVRYSCDKTYGGLGIPLLAGLKIRGTFVNHYPTISQVTKHFGGRLVSVNNGVYYGRVFNPGHLTYI